jgi:hypothetical protein
MKYNLKAIKHKERYNKFSHKPSGTIFYIGIDNYMYLSFNHKKGIFYNDTKIFPLLPQIINDKNIALLNVRHDDYFIRGIAENIVRGVEFKLEVIKDE